MTPAEAQALLVHARTGETDLERKMAASLLVTARVLPFPRVTMTTTETTSAGSSTMFKKATKTQAKLRLTLDGPAGSGKTYSALTLAKHLGGRVAVIDTEHGSASKYANLFDFDSVQLEEFSLETYIKTIEAARVAGYDVLVIDSLSHAWTGKGGALEQVDRAGGGGKANFTSGWRTVTPLHTRLIDAILAYPGHVICTMRTKMEYILTKNAKGQDVPQKVGMAPVQREGMEYEFDVVADLDISGNLTISKTRCPTLSGSAGMLTREEIGAVGEKLKAWLSDGAAPVPVVEASPPTATQAPSPAQQTLSIAPPPVTTTSTSRQPSPIEQFEVAISEATSKADLDKLVPRLQKLPLKEKAVVRSKFMARLRQLEVPNA